MGAESGDRAIAHRIVGKRRHENALLAEDGQGHGDIRLAAAESGLESRGLKKPLMIGRLEPEHDFAKRNDFIHIGRSIPYHSCAVNFLGLNNVLPDTDE